MKPFNIFTRNNCDSEYKAITGEALFFYATTSLQVRRLIVRLLPRDRFRATLQMDALDASDFLIFCPSSNSGRGVGGQYRMKARRA